MERANLSCDVLHCTIKYFLLLFIEGIYLPTHLIAT